MIHTFNNHKPISAYVQATWILINVSEGMWDEFEEFGMGRRTPKKSFLSYAKSTGPNAPVLLQLLRK